MAAVDTTARDTAGPSRPAARPSTQASRHHLEPNPFEQSFSSKPSGSGRSASPEGARSSAEGNKRLGHKSTKSDSGIDDGSEGRSAGLPEVGRKSLGGGPSTPGQAAAAKRLLPPASSLVSPAAHTGQEQPMHYPWGSSLTGSLRAGPLSPAMLAGPQNFDASSFNASAFRTGLTPDLAGFKTGLTPLGTAGGSFPPPSPNTAAFLAMVTNNGSTSLSAAGITPNTLSALGGNPMDAHTHNAGGNLQTHPLNSGPTDSSSASNKALAFARNNDQPGSKEKRGSPKTKRAGAPARGEGTNGSAQTTQAATGLFLLSQAHQELAAREDAADSQQVDPSFPNGVPDAKSLYSNGPASGSHQGDKEHESYLKNGKRKSAPDGKVAGAKKAKGTSKMEAYSPSAESDELMEEFSRPGKSGSSSNGGGSVMDDGGDDDEKRKNFLERNRQAALKCRQRKKAWLASLQTKVEYLQSDNENLQGTVGALRNEVMFLKSQLMQAQRQMAGQSMAPPGQDGMTRHSVSGPMGMPAGMMPTAITQVPHSNIHAMAAAAAAANSNANMLGPGNGGSGPGQFQTNSAHRPTHITQYGGQAGKAAPRQSSVQAM